MRRDGITVNTIEFSDCSVAASGGLITKAGLSPGPASHSLLMVRPLGMCAGVSTGSEIPNHYHEVGVGGVGPARHPALKNSRVVGRTLMEFAV